jgi:hypothetical protein
MPYDSALTEKAAISPTKANNGINIDFSFIVTILRVTARLLLCEATGRFSVA